jgi:hypothetical protein
MSTKILTSRTMLRRDGATLWPNRMAGHNSIQLVHSLEKVKHTFDKRRTRIELFVNYKMLKKLDDYFSREISETTPTLFLY